MRLKLRLCLVAVLMVLIFSCGPKVMVPPKIDLTELEVVGIIQFKSPNDDELGSHVTSKFTEAIRRDQEMVRIINLGLESEALKAVSCVHLNQDAFIALGDKYKVNTIITGKVTVTVGPSDVSVTPGFDFLKVTAAMNGTLEAQIVETMTGASIWNNSAKETKELGDVSIFGKKDFAFDAENPDKVYNELIDDLVEKVTEDFRATWVRE